MRPALLVVSCLLALAAASVAARPQHARELQQVRVFYDTPSVAGSSSLDVNGNLGLRPDGTVHAAAGGALTSTNAVSNPLLNVITGGAYNNRPKATSKAYTQIPLALQQTEYPTLSYGSAEGKGDLLSSSDGAWVNAEFGYNPLNNNLGGSVSTGTTNAANLGGGDVVGELGPNRGKSGVRFAGYSNDLTNAADSRTDQSAQAIAYPHNILNPASSLTCTQALLYAVTLTQYDLGTPVTPLPREGASSIIPFCLTLFNFGTLDDFSRFVNNGTFNNALPLPAGANTTGIAAGSGNEEGSTFVDPAGFAQPLPGSGTPEERAAAARAASNSNSSNSSNSSAATPPRREPATVGSTIADAVEQAPDALKQLAATPLFQALVERASNSVFAEAFDGLNELVARQVDKTTVALSQPLANLNQAVGKLAGSVAGGVTNAGLKGFAAAVETAEPLLAATAAVNRAVSPVARASKAAADKLAAESEKKVEQALSAAGASGGGAPAKQQPAAAGRRLKQL